MNSSVLCIRDAIYSSIQSHFRKNGFYEVAPPVLTPFSCESACVGGSDLISVDYYGQKAYLSQSAQLYLEAIALELDKVFCINPAFRAESTSLATHLSEFWMCEVEYINDSLENLVSNIQNLLFTIIKDVLSAPVTANAVPKQDKFLKMIEGNLPLLTYSEVISFLQKKGETIVWGENISKHQEQLICKTFNDYPVFITEYPTALSSFYKKESGNRKTVLAVDLIAPQGYCELVGGSVRKNDAEDIKCALVKSGADLNNFDWYLELIKNKPLPHSGYGLGIERLIAWLCELPSIQLSIPFPRTEGLIRP